MNGKSQIQGCKNWILPKDKNVNRFYRDLIGWKSGKTTYVPLRDRTERALAMDYEILSLSGVARTFYSENRYSRASFRLPKLAVRPLLAAACTAGS
jgi:hypothetical protein